MDEKPIEKHKKKPKPKKPKPCDPIKTLPLNLVKFSF